MHKSGKEHLYMQCSRCKIFNTNYQFTGAFSVILCLIYMNIEHTVFFFTLLPFFNKSYIKKYNTENTNGTNTTL